MIELFRIGKYKWKIVAPDGTNYAIGKLSEVVQAVRARYPHLTIHKNFDKDLPIDNQQK